MLRISKVVAIGFPHHPTQRGNYQECVSEDKDGLRQRLGCPGDYSPRNFFEIRVYCSTSKNQEMGAVPICRVLRESREELRYFNNTNSRFKNALDKKYS